MAPVFAVNPLSDQLSKRYQDHIWVIPCFYTSAAQDRYPVLSHPESSRGAPLGLGAVAEGLFAEDFFLSLALEAKRPPSFKGNLTFKKGNKIKPNRDTYGPGFGLQKMQFLSSLLSNQY